MFESLEDRFLLSMVGQVVDAGDSYYDYTNQREESLYRVTDRVVVGFFASSKARRARLEAALTASTGPLAGYKKIKDINDSSILLDRTARGPAAALSVLQNRISGFPNLKYFAPSFLYAADGARTAFYDEIYVDLRDDVDPAVAFARGYAKVVRATGVNAYNVTLRRGGGFDALRAAAELRTSPLVQAAEPNHTLTITPSFTFSNVDPIYNASADNRWNLTTTNAPSAWDKTTGNGDVVIAVLDNGVQLNHPDLQNNIFHNPIEAGNDEDGNGFAGDVSGWDFLSNDSDANPDPTSTKHPPDQHGTAVAGIAAAQGDNGLGYLGVAFHSKILPIRMMAGDPGTVGGNISTGAVLASAVRYAAGIDEQGDAV